MSNNVKTKKEVEYEAKYNKGTFLSDKQKLIDYINQSNVSILLISAGAYEDSTEFLTIKVDNIKS